MTDNIVTRSNMFVSRYTIDPDKREQFLAIFNPLWKNAIEFMRENCNFVYYGFGRDPNVMVAVESYKDESIVAALRETPEFKETVSRLLDCCSAPMTMELFSGIEMGDRDIFDAYPAGKSTVHPATDTADTRFL